MEFKNNLRAVRKAANYTLEKLAEETGYSVSMISRWESGERRLNQDSLKRLSSALRRPASEIVPHLLDSALDEKINRLKPEAQKMVDDYVDFLLQKHNADTGEQ